MSMQNQYPWWKYLILIVFAVLCIVYAIPNLYGDDPAVQVSGVGTQQVDHNTLKQLHSVLDKAKLSYKSMQIEQDNLLMVRFRDPDMQLKAQEYIKAALGDGYTVALNLAPATPHWFQAIGAKPIKLGLDLRGGVHFLLYIDADATIKKRVQDDLRDIGHALREAKIRYNRLSFDPDGSIDIGFRAKDAMHAAYKLLAQRYQEFTFRESSIADQHRLIGDLVPSIVAQERQDIVDQTIMVLRNRINELGVSEPVVQQQGQDRVVVDLPGIQDATQAKQIIGGTSTLEFRLVNTSADPFAVAGGAASPANARLYTLQNDQPILLSNRIVLKGSSITSATSTFSQETSEPVVNIRISGPGVGYFTRVTAESIGQRMGIVLVEMKVRSHLVDGEVQTRSQRVERVISAPRINSALGSAFQITGLEDMREARNIALQLRAGALPATISYLEESTVGPTLGKVNIRKGVLSVEIGFALIVVFMLLYYQVFGLIADIALLLNLVILLAVLSLLGAVLTLPGIAGILLTIGMAVDANVLIFERIREELRNGLSVQASIYAGYEKAFATIIDANVTTLIAAVTLFSLGSGAVKGFAITLTIGVLTSMLTAITGTRAIVNLLYGRRIVMQLPIGITVPPATTVGKPTT